MKKQNYELKEVAKPENFKAEDVDLVAIELMKDTIEDHLSLDEPVWCFPYTDEAPFKIWVVVLEDDGRLLARSRDSNAPEIMLNYLEFTSMTLERNRGVYETTSYQLEGNYDNSREFAEFREAYEDYRLEYDL